MDLISDRGRRVPVEDLNTTQLLAHAAQQKRSLHLDDMLIVDCDAHHYENESMGQIIPFIENDVIRQTAEMRGSASCQSLVPGQIGNQDMSGRVTRYVTGPAEKFTHPIKPVEIGFRWMDAMGVDYSCLFPTGMLHLANHPQIEVEVELCWAYNRWLTEKVIPESEGRLFSMLPIPFGDPQAAMRCVDEFGGRPGVKGFMVTSVRLNPVYHNVYMNLYRAMEERGHVLAFHSGPNWGEPVFKALNRFMSVHALTFPFYNILHLTNWVTNGLGERFPKLPVLWIEAGLAWIPFLMQRLDHEYMFRTSEVPTLKKKPSDYMRDMFYSSQPMEVQDMGALECTFRMMNAETQLLYASDYPHWDFDLPSTILDLPFLTEKAKHNILGGSAARLFKLQPRNEKQKENLVRFGNYHPPR